MKLHMTLLASVLLIATAAQAAPALSKSADWKGEIDIAKLPVYVATNATVPEIDAAKLLMRAQIMVAGGLYTTNVQPKVATTLPENAIVIGWQGSALVAPLAKELALVDWLDCGGKDVVIQKKRGKTYLVAANSPQGTCYATGDLLYRNGARFLHNGGDDGEEGTILEYMKALQGPKDFRYSPPVLIRNGFYTQCNKVPVKEREGALLAKNRFAVRNGAVGLGPLDGGRARLSVGAECIQPPVVEFKKHPTWFPMIDGKRWRPDPSSGWCWVVEGCWSCEEFADWVVDRVVKLVEQRGGKDKVFYVDLTNSDGGKRCNCPECMKLRASYPDDSSCYFDYQTKLALRIKEKCPWLRIETLAYIMSRSYPKAGNKVLTGIEAIDYCPYSRCFIHPYADKDCPTNENDLRRMAEWKKADLPVGDFDYLFDVFNPTMPLPVWELANDVVTYWIDFNKPHEVPMMYSEGAVEGGGRKSRIAAYVFARSMWDPSASADDFLADWCTHAFGEGAEPMLAYLRASGKAWTSQKVHLTACFNNPLGTAKTYFTPELQKLGETSFAAAAKALGAAAAKAPADARLQNRIRKQRAALDFEKKCFDEWKALREKAMTSSMEISLEMDEGDDSAFGRAAKLPMTTRHPKWQGEDITKSFVQVYRSKEALRVRLTSNDPLFEPQTWKENRENDKDFPWGFPVGTMEFFLQGPGQNGYYHIAFAPDGRCYDANAMDNKFDSPLWTVQSKQKKGFWEVTLTIPWKMFGLEEPKTGDIIKLVAINAGRKKNEKTGELQNFSVGLPFPAYHDIGIGADLKVEDATFRRPDAQQ